MPLMCRCSLSTSPDSPRWAYFEFSLGLTNATSQVVQDAIDLKSAGLDIDPAEFSEKNRLHL